VTNLKVETFVRSQTRYVISAPIRRLCFSGWRARLDDLARPALEEVLEFKQSIRFLSILSILASCFRVASYLLNLQEMKEIIDVGSKYADSAASINQKERNAFKKSITV
jgi:hypothetical protein